MRPPYQKALPPEPPIFSPEPSHADPPVDKTPIVMKNFITMQTLTVRDLRYDFAKVEKWLADGEEIEITKHGKPVAHLTKPHAKKPAAKFDAEAHRRWMKETWGDRVFSAEEVREMREAELGDVS